MEPEVKTPIWDVVIQNSRERGYVSKDDLSAIAEDYPEFPQILATLLEVSQIQLSQIVENGQLPDATFEYAVDLLIALSRTKVRNR